MRMIERQHHHRFAMLTCEAHAYPAWAFRLGMNDMGQRAKWCGWLWGLPLCAAQAVASEVWLVELEHDDGIRLQFQGAELERGSAPVWHQGEVWRDPLKPGSRLVVQVSDGIATRIELLTATAPSTDVRWQRAQDRLQTLTDSQLTLVTLGTVSLNPQVRWVNGSAGGLHAGSELVLTRSVDGILQEIEVVNPEE